MVLKLYKKVMGICIPCEFRKAEYETGGELEGSEKKTEPISWYAFLVSQCILRLESCA